VIRDILKLEKPDLAVITGDIISGNKLDKVTRPWAEL
jgi:predicted MPP superfamily phosphohydrolase